MDGDQERRSSTGQTRIAEPMGRNQDRREAVKKGTRREEVVEKTPGEVVEGWTRRGKAVVEEPGEVR